MAVFAIRMLLLLVTLLAVRGNALQLADVITDGVVYRTVPDYFMSLGIDSSLVRNRWEHLNLTSPMMRTLARGLAPLLLRLGGTAADFLFFEEVPRGEPLLWQSWNTPPQWNFVMTKNDVDNLVDFVGDVNWRLLFDLNVLVRKDGRWDPRNARRLIKYIVEKRYAPLFDWELGNEPNSLKHQTGRSVSAQQLATDFCSMVKLVGSYGAFNGSLYVGPGVTNPKRETIDMVNMDAMTYLLRYLKGITPSSTLNAVTWHQYYMNGHIATLYDFKKYSNLHQLQDQIAAARAVAQATGFGHVPMWLGETGSAYGGGAKGLSDRFAATFYYLDKLGVSARYGLDAVVRQTWYGGHYAMLNQDMTPAPDYWVALLYRRLVSSNVVKVTLQPAPQSTNAYCHCSPSGCANGVTIFGLCMHDKDVTLRIEKVGAKFVTAVDLYLLTGADYGSNYGLLSPYVRVNFGAILRLTNAGKLPIVKPKSIKKQHDGFSVKILPYSLFFIVLHF